MITKRFIAFLLSFLLLVASLPGQFPGPAPGDVYREYILNLKTGDNWRVTDPDALASGAGDFLPNPVMTIRIDDLEGATRAEALMDIWGGHTGTTGKKFRFNGNEWMAIPDHPSIAESPECYNAQFNYISEVPLVHLLEGDNTFEGTSGGQTCYSFNWGQWGWYVMLIRIYYGPEKPHPSGSIISHPSGSDVVELDTIVVEASSTAGIKQVDLLAEYTGYDENGDGIYRDWHRNYHTTLLEGHVGSAKMPPYTFVWDNRWVPDQVPAAVRLLARVRDSNDVWTVTPVADSISLVRPEGVSVKMFTAENVPRKFWVRAGERKSCDIIIDDLTYETNAILVHRTWNGQDGGAGSGTIPLPLYVNSWRGKVAGASHNYALSTRNIPVDTLVEGNNEVAYHSSTPEHGIEILWPGPAILVRYNDHAPRVETPVISPDPGEYTMPVEVSISCGTPGAEIYYTTAGSDPDVGSRKYTNPFTISDSAIVKAMATKFDCQPSNMVVHTYSSYQAPGLHRACKGEIENTVEVVFTKQVDRESAENVSNYSLNNGGIILDATIGPEDSSRVILSVDQMVEGKEYTLTVGNVTDNKGTSVPDQSSVTFIYAYIIEITASHAAEDHIPAHTMDEDFSTYWSANGTTGVWIQYDLGTIRLIRSVEIAFFLGDQRKSYFIIQTSVDGMNWIEVCNGESSGQTLDLEVFDFEDTTARYVRILGLGNTSTNNWNSYTEVKINWFSETAILNLNQDASFDIYPVPAVRGMHIIYPAWTGTTGILMVDAAGRIHHAVLTGRSTWIPTSDYASGIYTISIPMSGRMLTKRIIIMKE
jgi:hypothetical protein